MPPGRSGGGVGAKSPVWVSMFLSLCAQLEDLGDLRVELRGLGRLFF